VPYFFSSKGELKILPGKINDLPDNLRKKIIKGTPVKVIVQLISRGIAEGWLDDNAASKIVKQGYREKIWKDFDTLTWRYKK